MSRERGGARDDRHVAPRIGRGRLFGERTAGKALLHLPAPLEDGSVLLISTARLVRLDGEEIRSGADGSPERATR